MFFCNYCQKEYKTKLSLGSHQCKCPSNKNRHYVNGMTGKSAWNKGLSAKNNESIKRAAKTFSENAKKNPRKRTVEQSLKQSKSLREYWKNNPDKHPWKKSSKFKSVPCDFLKQKLTANGIQFIEEWQPLENRNFSIDIAFPDIKLGIEVNGNQHYDSYSKLKPYYQTRHNLIEQAGWTLIELHYVSCYDNEILEKILINKEQPDYTKYFLEKKLRKIKPKVVKTKKSNNQKQKNLLKNKPLVEQIINSGINFSVFGWVQQVSKILNICPQKVSQWMKRNMLEFYETKCFKRLSH